MARLRALRGGAIVAGTTSPQLVDLTAFIGHDVLIFCPTQDVLFSATATTPLGSQTLATTATAPSLTALVADRAPAGFGKVRCVAGEDPYLIVQLAVGSDNITIKKVSQKSLAE